MEKKMKIIKTLSAAALFCLICPSVQAASPSSEQGVQAGFKTIDAQTLHQWIQSQTPMILVDARGNKYFDGVLIETAQRLPSDASDDLITQLLPNKDQQIVVYCAGEGCPASEILANRLAVAGYTQVYDYHGGIKEWTSLNKPTTTVK